MFQKKPFVYHHTVLHNDCDRRPKLDGTANPF